MLLQTKSTKPHKKVTLKREKGIQKDNRGLPKADLTLRNVKAVHLSSSVPSGDSMRPVKQAFQISRTKRGAGIR